MMVIFGKPYNKFKKGMLDQQKSNHVQRAIHAKQMQVRKT